MIKKLSILCVFFCFHLCACQGKGQDDVFSVEGIAAKNVDREEKTVDEEMTFVVIYNEFSIKERPDRMALIYLNGDSIPELLILKDGEYKLYSVEGTEVKEIEIQSTEIKANAYGPRHQFEEEDRLCFYWFEYVPYKSMLRLHGGDSEERYDYYLRYEYDSLKTEFIAKSMDYEWHTYDADKEIEHEEFMVRIAELGYDKLIPCDYLYENVITAYEKMDRKSDTKGVLEEFVKGEMKALYYVEDSNEISQDSLMMKSYEELYEDITGGEDWWGEKEYIDFDNDGEEELVLHGYAGARMFFDVIGDTVYVLLRTGSTTDNASVAEMNGKYVIERTDLLHGGRKYYRIMQYDSCGCLVDYFSLSASFEGENYSQDDEFRYRNREITMEEFEMLVDSIQQQ